MYNVNTVSVILFCRAGLLRNKITWKTETNLRCNCSNFYVTFLERYFFQALDQKWKKMLASPFAVLTIQFEFADKFRGDSKLYKTVITIKCFFGNSCAQLKRDCNICMFNSAELAAGAGGQLDRSSTTR